MSKLKTHSGSKKRFKITKNKKVKYWHANKNHILTKKSVRRKRDLRKGGIVDKTNLIAIKHLMPYA